MEKASMIYEYESLLVSNRRKGKKLYTFFAKESLLEDENNNEAWGGKIRAMT
jgi:hypothetical protein